MQKLTIDLMIERAESVAEAFDNVASRGYPSGRYAADAVRERITDLRVRLAEGDKMAIASRLLDMVPSATDLDAIGFDLAKHSALSDILDEVEVDAAELSCDYVDDDDGDDEHEHEHEDSR